HDDLISLRCRLLSRGFGGSGGLGGRWRRGGSVQDGWRARLRLFVGGLVALIGGGDEAGELYSCFPSGEVFARGTRSWLRHNRQSPFFLQVSTHSHSGEH